MNMSSLDQALSELRQERTRVEGAIATLEKILYRSGKRPGRPKGSNTRAPSATRRSTWTKAKRLEHGKKISAARTKDKPKKRNWSPAARRAAAQRMKAYWAERAKKKAGLSR